MLKSALSSECFPAMFALPKGSVVVVAGGPDTGKTTFARETIQQFLIQCSEDAVLIDSDISTGDLSTPGVVTAAVANHTTGADSARQWPVIFKAFVGALSARRSGLDWLAAVVAAVNHARRTQSGIIIIDTPAFTNSNSDAKNFRLLVQTVEPSMIIVLQRKSEASLLARELERQSMPPIAVEVAVDPVVTRKSPAVRQSARSARFSAKFREATRHIVPWSSVSLLSTNITSGTPQPHQILKFIGNALKSNNMHAEIVPSGGLFAILDTSFDEAGGRGLLEDHFKSRHISLVDSRVYEHLLCGLIGSDGALLDVALIEGIDFTQQIVTLLTTLKHMSPVARIVFGRHRVMPNGREIGDVTGTAL